MKRLSLHRAGFTLLEIMIVVLIIGLLIGVAVKGVKQLEYARVIASQAHIEGYKTNLLMYQGMNGNYPTTEQGLKALITKPSSEPRPRQWRQIMEAPTLDPWQHEYNYVMPGKHNTTGFDIYSSGPDGIPDTADDIGNWEAAPTN
jgi:general secretion pathway protein G